MLLAVAVSAALITNSRDPGRIAFFQAVGVTAQLTGFISNHLCDWVQEEQFGTMCSTTHIGSCPLHEHPRHYCGTEVICLLPICTDTHIHICV